MWKDSETELDFLDYEYLVNSVKEIVFNDNLLPASIGIYGDWGSGKSSLIHMCKKQLENEDENIQCIVFNGWLFESYDDAKSAILGSILDEIKSNEKTTTETKSILKGLYKSIDKLKLAKIVLGVGVDTITTGGFGTLLKLLLNTTEKSVKIEDLVQNIKDELNFNDLRDDLREFQANFEKLIKESKISRLVVFIDELDRCRPDTILDTLEAIKLFMFTGNVVFVIGADERHISYAVRSKFSEIEGIQIDIGKEYLEKLIQYPIRIPRLNNKEVEIYLGCLLLQAEFNNELFEKVLTEINRQKKDDFEKLSLVKVKENIELNDNEDAIYDNCVSIATQLSVVLSSGLHGNPRQCKRFLNTLDMRQRMAKYKNKELDRKILAKIMMLEYIKPALFNKLNELLIKNELSKELSIFELGDKDKIKGKCPSLKTWENDEWALNWAKSEPLLSDKDLKLYFYFSRTSLDEKISRVSSILSPESKKILDDLCSKADAKINTAIDEISNISESEIANILEALAVKMLSEIKIDDKYFKSFFGIGKKKHELKSSIIEYTKSFSAEQIKPSTMVLFADFAKNTDTVNEFREIIEKWNNHNNKLVQLFEKTLKTQK